jgi:hypothetical protein
MKEIPKPIDNLQIADLQAHPVWEYVDDEEYDETFVKPAERTRSSDLGGRVIGAPVVLANGQHVWALLGNIDPKNSRRTEHFLTVSIERNGSWFMLARYHDFSYAANGPNALAKFLGLPTDDIFPITYDVRKYAVGDAAALCGVIREEPRERLSDAEIMAMAVS